MIDHNILIDQGVDASEKTAMQVTLSEKAYQHIRGMLASRELSPGQRLVTRTLAEEIGVSLAPVREALYRLATEGLVEHVPGAGAFVRKPDRQELEELYILRDLTESYAAAEAAKHASEECLDELDAIVDAWTEIAEAIAASPKGHATKAQFNRWLDNEELFHEILVESSRNRLLAKVVHDYRAISSVFEAQRETPSILTHAVAERTCRSRRELLKALRVRDAELAKKLTSEQIQQGRKTVLGHLSRVK